MKTQSTLSKLARYAGFQTLGMLGLSCYILSDTFFIAGALGEEGLAALNYALPVYNLLFGAGLLLGVGGATRFTLSAARGQKREARGALGSALFYGLLASLVCMAAGLFFSVPLAGWLGAGEATRSMTALYMKTVLLFAPAFVLYHLFSAFVRNDGAPRLAMAAMLISSFSNILLDYLLIWRLGRGIFGAALSTGIAPLLGLAVLLLRPFQKESCLKPLWGHPAPLSFLCAPGLAAALEELSGGLILLTFNLVILRLTGDTGVAAYGVVANLGLVATALFSGIAQGIQPVASQSYATGHRRSFRLVRRFGLISAGLLAAVLYAGVFFGGTLLVSLFIREGSAALAALAGPGLRLYFTGFFFAGINQVAASFLGASEQEKSAFFIALLRGAVALLPLLFLGAALFGMTGVWLAFPAAEAAALLFTLPLLRKADLTAQAVCQG